MSIYPSQITEAIKFLNSKIDFHYEAENSKFVLSRNSMKEKLYDMGQPTKLEAYKSGGVMTETCWGKIEKIQSMGKHAGGPKQLIIDMFNELTKIAVTSNDKFIHCEHAIVREEANDDKFRFSQPSWTGQPTSALNRDIKQHLSRLKEAFTNARKNDEIISSNVSELFMEFENSHTDKSSLNFNILTLTRKQIEDLYLKHLPGSFDLLSLDDDSQGDKQTSGNSSLVETAKNLESILIQVASNIERQETLLNSISQSKAKVKDFATEMLKGKSGSITPLKMSETFLENNTILFVDQLRTTEALQLSLLDEVVKVNQKFIMYTQDDPLTLHRTNVN